MLYFIPAWYQEDQWCENEQTWHVRREHTEFDDTVKQVQLFHRSRAYPYRIMLLSFAPNFRHFLHRQGVYRAPYWSCFDAIQEIRRKKAMVLSFHNLNWPADIEFEYNPFVVIALRKRQKYAQIEFGEDGNPIRIDLYQDGKVSRRNLYDDRGFVSSTILFEDGPHHQDYLMEDGTWKMRYFHQDGHVEINPKHREYLLAYEDGEQRPRFSRLRYENMEEAIREVLEAYLSLTDKADIFCAAMHGRHAPLLGKALERKKTILSFFGNRYPLDMHSEMLDMVRRADYIIADSDGNLKQIQRAAGPSVQNITAISPYDSRVDSGISQQFEVQKLLVPVDGMEEGRFQAVIGILGRYFYENGNARVHLFTRNAAYDMEERLLERTRRALRKAGLEEGWASKEAGEPAPEDMLETEEVPVMFFVEQCVDELTVTKCMREQRLLIDMRDVPELYLQITAISIGIPQIVRTRTEFVEPGRNGIVIREMKKLPEALRYYLDSVANWNEAMVCSYEIGKDYTTDRLIEDWKEVIYFIG